MKVEVKAISHGVEQIQELEVELLENAAGRVVIQHGAPVVEVVDLCGLEGKIRERTLIARPRDGVLMGQVTPKGARRQQDGGVKVAGRLAHQALYDCCAAIDAAIDAARKAMWAEISAAADAAILARVPAGHVLLRFVRSEADGWVEVWADDVGRELRSPRMAGQQGWTGWLTPEDYRSAVEAHDAEAAASAEADRRRAQVDERRGQALATATVPATAVAAYRRYQGDDESAWAAEDESAWAAIREWGPAIEAQGLAAPGPAVVARLLRSDDLAVAEG